ncbi:MAG: hypothetical protein CM1200mP18_15400 [Gammaproteobacteria bacterium]|nr:MAG: hypothetical protein CM1200mP18_15400 [Gammaproteobacteria bacterium]
MWREKKLLLARCTDIFLIAAILGSLIAPYDPNGMDFYMMEPPSWSHPLGTDDLGGIFESRHRRCSGISFCWRIDRHIALVAGFSWNSRGVLGGWVDHIIMRTSTRMGVP